MNRDEQQAKVQFGIDYFYNKSNTNNGPFLIERKIINQYPTFAKTGHWNEKQKLKYVIFLDSHHEKLAKKQNRRLWKVFKAMSDFIKTRNPNQCRSHHQKMETQFKTSLDIIQYFKSKYTDYEQRRFHYQTQLNQISFSLPLKLNQPNQLEFNQNYPQLNCSNNQSVLKKDIHNEQFIQQKQVFLCRKQQDQKNKQLPPTDENYDQEYQNFSVYSSNRLTDKINSFTGQLDNNLKRPQYIQNPYIQIQQPFINPYLNPNTAVFASNYALGPPPSIYPYNYDHYQSFIKNQWMDCHQKFISWITTLHKLINKDNNRINGREFQRNNF